MYQLYLLLLSVTLSIFKLFLEDNLVPNYLGEGVQIEEILGDAKKLKPAVLEPLGDTILRVK